MEAPFHDTALPPVPLLLFDREQAEAKDDGKEQVPFDGKRKLALIIFVAIVLFTAYGCLKLEFGLGQFAALYVVMAIILAVIFRINVNQL